MPLLPNSKHILRKMSIGVKINTLTSFPKLSLNLKFSDITKFKIRKPSSEMDSLVFSKKFEAE